MKIRGTFELEVDPETGEVVFTAILPPADSPLDFRDMKKYQCRLRAFGHDLGLPEEFKSGALKRAAEKAVLNTLRSIYEDPARP